MADASNRKAKQAVRAAQARFEREQATSQEARRKAFAQAQKSGLTLREIGKEAWFPAPAAPCLVDAGISAPACRKGRAVNHRNFAPNSLPEVCPAVARRVARFRGTALASRIPR
jgi:hypothetical protein